VAPPTGLYLVGVDYETNSLGSLTPVT